MKARTRIWEPQRLQRKGLPLSAAQQAAAQGINLAPASGRYMLNDSGQFVGFEIDLLNAAAKSGGFDVEYKNVPWGGILSGLQDGSCDAVMSCVTIIDERKNAIDFSIPYIKLGEVLIIKSEVTGIRTLADLSGKVAATQSDTISGKNAAFLCDELFAKYYVLQIPNYKGKLKIAGPPLNEEYYGIAVKKGNSRVLNSLNAGLKRVLDSGQNRAIEQKWLK